MAQTVKETVRVESLGKWGPKIGNEFYGWSKQIKEADKGKVVPGGEYLLDVYIADSGKKYVNAVTPVNNTGLMPKLDTSMGRGSPVLPKATAKAEAQSPVRASELAKKLDKIDGQKDAMSRSDWDAKDRRISRQGCIQIAVQVESKFEDAVKLAERMLEFVNG